MKITHKKLRRLIKEEVTRLLPAKETHRPHSVSQLGWMWRKMVYEFDGDNDMGYPEIAKRWDVTSTAADPGKRRDTRKELSDRWDKIALEVHPSQGKVTSRELESGMQERLETKLGEILKRLDREYDVPVDTDNDGTPDYRDTDSDNDGIPDETEMQ